VPAAVVAAVFVVLCVHEDIQAQLRLVSRVAGFERENNSLVNCTKRMTVSVVSSFVRKSVVAKDVPHPLT
jgi:hypothetical protein